MNYFESVNNLGKKMTWFDFSLLKLSVFFFTLFLITVWPIFRNFVLGIDWYWYLITSIILAIPLWKKMFSN